MARAVTSEMQHARAAIAFVIVATACSASMAAPGEPSVSAAPDASAVTSAARFVPADEPIPVLLFHAVCPDVCEEANLYGVTQGELARMLAMIRSRGYTSATSAEYLRALRGEGNTTKPIFVTFDDGRRDAYELATPILDAAGVQATMFVITDRQEAHDPAFMSWDHVRAAQASGTWDIQLHADRGHVKTRFDATASTGASYANRRYGLGPTSALETRDAWRARVEGDLDRGIALLRANVPGFVPLTMAVPFGNYGQNQSNDAALAPELSAMLDARFEAWFTQETPYTTGVRSDRERLRFTVVRTTTTEMVASWLDEQSRAHR